MTILKEMIIRYETDGRTVKGYDAGELIRCKDCWYWARNDGMFKDIDGKVWHHCPHLEIDTDAYFYCGEAERKDNARKNDR